ncbi:MAG: hypothetical protein ABSA52_18795, partial [Candidatus Binatia bacterium]
ALTRWLWLPNFALQARVTCTDCFVTCTGKTDGPLAQIQAVMSTILFARAAGITYVHTPLRVVEHGRGHDDWARRWEEFFGFGNGERSLADLPPGLRQVRVEYPQRILKRRRAACSKNATLSGFRPQTRDKETTNENSRVLVEIAFVCRGFYGRASCGHSARRGCGNPGLEPRTLPITECWLAAVGGPPPGSSQVLPRPHG